MKAKVLGTKETIRNFKALSRNITGPARSAAKHSLEPTLAAAKQNVAASGHVRTGLLQKSLVIRLDKKSPKTKPRYFVGPATEAKRGGAKAIRYAHLLEFGRHSVHPYPGVRFLTRAFLETKEEVVRRYGALIGLALEKRAAQLSKKAK